MKRVGNLGRTAILTAAIMGCAVGLCVLGIPAGSQNLQAQERKVERHPHIRKALEELREARTELKEADHDFGGHRKEALEAVDAAIVQLGAQSQIRNRKLARISPPRGVCTTSGWNCTPQNLRLGAATAAAGQLALSPTRSNPVGSASIRSPCDIQTGISSPAVKP